MVKRIVCVSICAVIAVAASTHAAENLVINGDFSDPEPLKGWRSDYRFQNNSIFMNNHERITLAKSAGGYRNAAKIAHPGGWSEIRLESNPIKFEQGYRYSCTMDIKGANTRVYFAGYKWKPGIRPHPEPKDGEMRMIYKSKPVAGSYRNGKRISFSIPGVKTSKAALKHLRLVRFIRVFVWTGHYTGSKPEVLVDNVVVTRKPYNVKKNMK